MAKGGYYGGSTLIGPGSDWFSYGKSKGAKRPMSAQEKEKAAACEAAKKQRKREAAKRAAELAATKAQEKEIRKQDAEKRRLEKLENKQKAYAAQSEKRRKNPRIPPNHMANVEVVIKKKRTIHPAVQKATPLLSK